MTGTASLAELVGVGLALVAQDVGLAGDDQGRGQAGELLDRGAQRGGGDLGALGGVGGVLVPEPLHAVAAQEVALGELVVRAGVEGRVGDRIEEHLLHQGYVPALLGHQRQRGGHVAADRVPGDRDAGGVEVLGGAVGDDPAGDGVVLLDGNGVPGLGRQVVLGEDDGGAGAGGEFADQAVVRVGVAEDPKAGAVEVEDHRQGVGGTGGADDPGTDAAGRAALDGDPLLVDVRLFNVTGLDLVHGLAALGRGQVEQERRLRRRRREIRRGRLQDRGSGHVRGHGRLLREQSPDRCVRLTKRNLVRDYLAHKLIGDVEIAPSVG